LTGPWICPKCKIGDTPSKRNLPIDDAPQPARRSASPSDIQAVTAQTKPAFRSELPYDLDKPQQPMTMTMPPRNLYSKKASKRKMPETDQRRPTMIKIKLPAMAVNQKSARPTIPRKRRRSSPTLVEDLRETTEPKEPEVPFGGIITGADADTSKTSVCKVDLDLFESTRRAAEVSFSFLKIV